MACGTPVIAFDRGSMPELIISGINGFLVDDVEGAVEALAQVGRLERAVCRRTVEERFSAEHMVDEYLSVYREILSAAGDLDRLPPAL
jgi:glycosyltransferase involved in cell wall biosynthesis